MALKHLGRSNEAAQYHRKELELMAPERGSDKAVTLHCLAVALDQAGEVRACENKGKRREHVSNMCCD